MNTYVTCFLRNIFHPVHYLIGYSLFSLDLVKVHRTIGIFEIERIAVYSLAKLTTAKMGQSCTSFRYCFFETSENDGTLEIQMNPCQSEKKRVENKAIETGIFLSIVNMKKIHTRSLVKLQQLL